VFSVFDEKTQKYDIKNWIFQFDATSGVPK
jgi:hypothetical protein